MWLIMAATVLMAFLVALVALWNESWAEKRGTPDDATRPPVPAADLPTLGTGVRQLKRPRVEGPTEQTPHAASPDRKARILELIRHTQTKS